MWSELGSPPAPSEAEVTVIGPGYGEAVVVHLGNGEWLLVDSCVDTVGDGCRAVPLKYLRGLGVQVESAVKFIIISHWDDDHVRGIADIVEACPSALVCCSPALTKREFTNFVEARSIGASATDGANVRDVRRVLELVASRGQTIRKAAPARLLLQRPHVRSWSPSDYEDSLFLEFVARMHPNAEQTMGKAIPGSPNLTSIVLSIDWDGASALLGGDMEAHSDNKRGWGAIVSEAARVGYNQGNLVKVPHHGSHTGHDDRMWAQLLTAKPISVIAPFGRGPIDKRAPKSSDVRRINSLSSATFLTAPHTKTKLPKREYAVARSLREGMIRSTSRKAPLGIVQLRRLPGNHWRPALFGSARRAK